MKKEEREVSVYVYKVILMLWIIMFHYSDHGIIDMLEEPMSMQWLVLAIARIGGGVGNCGFAIMSGYLLWGKQFKVNRIIKLYLEVWLYSVALGGVSFALAGQGVDWKEVIRIFMPVTFSEYWYMSSYMVLYFLFPYINIFLNVLEKRQHIVLILFGLLFFSIIPTFLHSNWAVGANNIPIMIVCYIVGVYLRRYSDKRGENKKYNLEIFVVGLGCIFLTEIILKINGHNPTIFIWPMYKFPVIILAIALFLTIKPIKIRNIYAVKIWEILANSVFGVYIIHIGRMNELFFELLFNNKCAYENNSLLLHMLCSAFLIMLICTIIDLLRIQWIEKRLLNVMSKSLMRLDNMSKKYVPYIQYNHEVGKG